jgi:hypothetical protein
MTDRKKFISEGGGAEPSGAVSLRKEMPIAPWSLIQRPTIEQLAEFGTPNVGLKDQVNAWRRDNVDRLRTRDFTLEDAYRTLGQLHGGERIEFVESLRPLDKIALARDLGIAGYYGSLYLRVLRKDGDVESLGLASLRLVTNNGVGFIVDAFQNLTELENMKFHGIGTGTNAEAAGDSALQTELTTQYIVNSTRATGTTTENASNIYETVATNEVDAAVAITEHGILSQAATGGGTLLDRSVFSAVNLASGDRLESTYRLTINSGG